MKSESIKALAEALAKAQAVIKGAKSDSTNPFFKSHYADLGSVWDAIRKPLTDNGISVTQLCNWKEDMGWHVVTKIIHSSGEWLEGYFPIVVAKPNDPQALGSAMTYARRYALAAAIGVYQTDDDAEAATVREQKTEPVTKPQVNPKNCAHKWYPSKYKKDEEYCAVCKSKRPKPSEKEPEPEDNIPF